MKYYYFHFKVFFRSVTTLDDLRWLAQNNMHQNDAFFRGISRFFRGIFSLLELLRSVGYILPCAGKTFNFNIADLTQFFREIQRAEYFGSILARLSIEDLEKMTMQFEDQMKEIVIGEKYDCWRHKVFL